MTLTLHPWIQRPIYRLNLLYIIFGSWFCIDGVSISCILTLKRICEMQALKPSSTALHQNFCTNCSLRIVERVCSSKTIIESDSFFNYTHCRISFFFYQDDSSFEAPPRLNGTSDSFALSERDVRRQLEWSMLSSPEKGDKTGLSDFSTIRKVTSAPYSSVDNAKTLLSSQLQKMSQRNFDKSVELRTPYRQAIDCYPVYGVERDDKKKEPEQTQREAWMPVPNPSRLSPEKAGDKNFNALARYVYKFYASPYYNSIF